MSRFLYHTVTYRGDFFLPPTVPFILLEAAYLSKRSVAISPFTVQSTFFKTFAVCPALDTYIYILSSLQKCVAVILSM